MAIGKKPAPKKTPATGGKSAAPSKSAGRK
jgi:hypothetical protein